MCCQKLGTEGHGEYVLEREKGFPTDPIVVGNKVPAMGQ